ncbi:hypothetical protein [Acidovorax sp.]|uniref:hypothetical protein n=1 Tax=Acidovorax sp. TaxID=1872122 RepID=UPI00391A8D91
MLYIVNWTIVMLLFALWSLAAWAFHAVVVWAITMAPTLTGPAADLSSVPVPAWLLQFLPIEAIQGLIVALTETWTLLAGFLNAAPSVVSGVTAVTWAVWGLGSASLLALGVGIHLCVSLWVRRSAGTAKVPA